MWMLQDRTLHSIALSDRLPLTASMSAQGMAAGRCYHHKQKRQQVQTRGSLVIFMHDAAAGA